MRYGQFHPDGHERLLASLAYVLPALDGFEYGGYLYRELPALGAVAKCVAPMVTAYHAVPITAFAFFLSLSIFVSGGQRYSLSSFVRFNIQQALFLDLMLLMPFLFPELNNWCLHTLGPAFTILFRSGMFSTWVLIVGYAMLSNSQGVLPDRVPVLSAAAKQIVDAS